MNNNDAYYNITVTFNDINFTSYEINDLTFYRVPLKQPASFCILNLDLYIIHQQLINDIINANFSSNARPKVTITIATVDLNSQITPRRYRDNKVLFKKTYSIIKMSDLPFNIIENVSNTTFVCVDILLHHLSGINTFNDNLLKITGNDSLKKYESYLTSQYGDNFNYRKVNITDEYINKFILNQILIQSKSDILIPNELIEKYNILHSFCMYFFDDFSLAEENSKLIDAVFVNFVDIDNFKRINIFDSKLKLSQILKIESLNDPKNPLNHLYGQNISSSNSTGNFFQNKNQNQVDVVQVKNTSSGVQMLNTERDFKSINSVNIDYVKKPALGNLNINSKFDTETSNKNFNYLVNQLTNTFHKIITIFSSYTLPTELQFGYSYNFEFKLDDTTSSGAKYSYTPISIVNTFQKESVQSPYCIHNSKSQLLKFK